VSGGGEGAPAGLVPVAPSRECVGCGFDVVGRRVDAKCPECELPVRKTCGRWMLREDVGRGRRVVWSAWCLVVGVGLPVVMLGFLIFADFFGSLWPWVNALVHAVDGDVFGVSFFWVVCVCLALSLHLLANAARAPFWMRAGSVLGTLLPAVWISILQTEVRYSQIGSTLQSAWPILMAVAIVLHSMAHAWSLREVAGVCDRYLAMASTKRLYLVTKLWCCLGVVPAFGALLLLFAVSYFDSSRGASFMWRVLLLFSLTVLLPATLAVVVYAIMNWVRVLRAVRREMEFGCYAELK